MGTMHADASLLALTASMLTTWSVTAQYGGREKWRGKEREGEKRKRGKERKRPIKKTMKQR
jgi:hypothetical protein